mmetsp:Transcript_16902/g.30285  ORF Transcript_16902/g.30285 Transcript_16902/m.30285 type:complete len:253 (-) Transcript_16902:581-1339(-)
MSRMYPKRNPGRARFYIILHSCSFFCFVFEQFKVEILDVFMVVLEGRHRSRWVSRAVFRYCVVKKLESVFLQLRNRHRKRQLCKVNFWISQNHKVIIIHSAVSTSVLLFIQILLHLFLQILEFLEQMQSTVNISQFCSHFGRTRCQWFHNFGDKWYFREYNRLLFVSIIRLSDRSCQRCKLQDVEDMLVPFFIIISFVRYQKLICFVKSRTESSDVFEGKKEASVLFSVVQIPHVGLIMPVTTKEKVMLPVL